MCLRKPPPALPHGPSRGQGPPPLAWAGSRVEPRTGRPPASPERGSSRAGPGNAAARTPQRPWRRGSGPAAPARSLRGTASPATRQRPALSRPSGPQPPLRPHCHLPARRRGRAPVSRGRAPVSRCRCARARQPPLARAAPRAGEEKATAPRSHETCGAGGRSEAGREAMPLPGAGRRFLGVAAPGPSAVPPGAAAGCAGKRAEPAPTVEAAGLRA